MRIDIFYGYKRINFLEKLNSHSSQSSIQAYSRITMFSRLRQRVLVFLIVTLITLTSAVPSFFFGVPSKIQDSPSSIDTSTRLFGGDGGGFFTKVGDEAKDGADTVGDGVKNATDTVGNGVNDAVNTVGDGIKDLVGVTEGEIQGVAKKAAQALDTACKTIGTSQACKAAEFGAEV